MFKLLAENMQIMIQAGLHMMFELCTHCLKDWILSDLQLILVLRVTKVWTKS